jgi:hypothetical protein
MASGDIITATRYNQIQAVVSSVLGVGASDTGYGQSLFSSQVAPSQTITADHMNKLRRDMLSTFVHQTGTNTGFTLPLLVSGTDLVSDAPSSIGKNEYESYPILANILLTNRNSYTPAAITNNFTSEFNRITSSRNTSWGGEGQTPSIFHEIRVQFASANERRYFFNTGSEIRFEANLSNFPGGPGLQKYDNWRGMFVGMGIISFKSTFTTSTGSGTSAPVGNFNLTSTYQQIFRKDGTGLYSANNYIIKSKEIDSRTIQFLIEFNDLDQGSNQFGGGPIDEPVEGVLVSRVHQLRATGTGIGNIDKVIVNSPTYQNIKNL